MTRPGQPPDEPGTRRQPDGPQVPAQQPEIENLREPEDSYDLPIPDPYCDFDPPRLPPNAIVIDRIRDWQPDAPPSLAELLKSIRTREPEPEPDLEGSNTGYSRLGEEGSYADQGGRGCRWG